MATDQLPAWSAATHPRPGEPGSPLLVATTDGRRHPGDRTIIVAQGIRSWIEPFEMQRFSLIAERLRARLVVVETPGFGTAGSRLLPPERRALRCGDFGPLATRMVTAAQSALEETTVGEPISFLGYSLGASIAAAMARAAADQQWRVDELVLVEPVALQRWTALDLLAATLREDRWIDDHLATNETVPGATTPWDRRPGIRPPTVRRRDLLALALALRHGRLRTDLLTTPARRVVVVRGDSSALSTTAAGPAVAHLRNRGVRVDELTVPGHHAVWHSLPTVDTIAHQLRMLIDTAP